MIEYICLDCGMPYPADGLPYRCASCGGIFTLRGLSYDLGKKTGLPGMWAYRDLIARPDLPVCWLGEGRTPLVERTVQGCRLYAKLESLNPSGSFKDRNAAILTSQLLGRNVQRVVEDSSGNAGAALAFYSSAFGIESTIFVPQSANSPKIQQIVNCGSNLIRVPGPRQNAQNEVLRAAENGFGSYASHAALPFGMAAYATIAFEIYEQLGRLPDKIYCPIGHGSLFYGILLGFEAIAASLGNAARPAMVGVQPAVCAPLAAAWKNLRFSYAGEPSLAEGTVIANPARGREILAALKPGVDDLAAIEEKEIENAHSALMKNGLYVEATSALVFAALKQAKDADRACNVLIFTGNGLKSSR
jgi:threonine synthase